MGTKKRRKLIAGNWKMNKTPSQTKVFVEELNRRLEGVRGCDTVICVPFVDIPAAVRTAKARCITVGAQNMHHEPSGAYTGEISSQMLQDLGVKYVIVGHSERRRDFGETDVIVNKKLRAALGGNMIPILCVGESIEQRERGVTEELICLQIKEALSGVEARQVRRIVIAYEPIWAIGTGMTATVEDAREVCALIRAQIRRVFGAAAARSVRILYGGSMNAKNAKGLLACPDIDGGLIGGASLSADEFITIIEEAVQAGGDDEKPVPVE
ncbi:MAG: triose-phosphate isomerase [Clostridiales bacterium]|nr:triose-phosphate isomerase [Clostridiales bacterium]